MTRRPFGDALDAALSATGEGASPAAYHGIGTLGLFAAPYGRRWREGPPYRCAPAAGGATVLVAPPLAEPPLRPRTDVERAAWQTLQGLGATLPPACTATHLKRAFRRLARQLHPDGHPALGAAARADLCRRFADARDAYETLLAIGR
jgi:hypothetical protein